MDVTALLNAAEEARQKAYAPYSNFPVGAAVLTEDGSVFTGCNVENAVYGLSICAERVALYRAICEGHKKFAAVAVIGDSEKFTRPCGACRQVIAEFGNETAVIMANKNREYQVETIENLLPGRFSL